MRAVVSAPGRVSHKCSICAKVGPWSESWSWFGSYKELEDGGDIFKFCSNECKSDAVVNGMVPHESDIAA